ncbi:MAG: hypothetical protein JST22_03525 [Bacteroidetes bacterium]|nr:hypothetical protein [Bacteroidota bacterium]
MIGVETSIDVFVCKGFSGEIVRARICLDDTVERALPLIADQIGYYTADYEKIGLYNMTRDFEYLMTDRFGERGTLPGDLIIMADGAACHKE